MGGIREPFNIKYALKYRWTKKQGWKIWIFVTNYSQNDAKTKDSKESQREPKVSQRATKNEPMGKVSWQMRKNTTQWRKTKSKCEPKRPKWSQSRAEGSQKIAKREPNGDQNASKSRCSDKWTKDVRKRKHPDSSRGSFWVPFSIKNVFKNQCKSQCRKSMEIYEKMLQK